MHDAVGNGLNRRVVGQPETSAREELDERLNQQQALNELAWLAWEARSVSSYADELVRRVAETLGVGFAKVLELAPDGQRFTLRSAVGFNPELVGEPIVEVGNESQAGYALVSPKPVVVEDFAREARGFAPSPFLRRYGIMSAMSVAIRVHGVVWGVLGVHATRARTFSRWEQSFLQDAARWLARAIERHYAMRRERAYQQCFDFLCDANAALAAAGDAEASLETAAHLAVGAIADLCFIDVVEGDGTAYGRIRRSRAFLPEDWSEDKKELARRLASRHPLDPTASHGTPKVLRTGQPELLREVRPEALRSEGHDDEHLQLMMRLDPQSYLNVPLRVGLRTIGTMVFLSCRKDGEPGRRYGEEELRMADGLARCTALAIRDGLGDLCDAQEQEELDALTKNLAREGPRVVENPVPAERPRLSPRQLEILALLDAGKSDAEVARELHLSLNTVRNHVAAIRGAFKAGSKIEALRRARELGGYLSGPEGGD